MSEKKGKEVAKILEAWNPLGDSADTVRDLEGYKYEAMDILSTYNLMTGPNKIAKATKQVLEQAFGLILNDSDVEKVANEISKVIIK